MPFTSRAWVLIKLPLSGGRGRWVGGGRRGLPQGKYSLEEWLFVRQEWPNVAEQELFVRQEWPTVAKSDFSFVESDQPWQKSDFSSVESDQPWQKSDFLLVKTCHFSNKSKSTSQTERVHDFQKKITSAEKVQKSPNWNFRRKGRGRGGWPFRSNAEVCNKTQAPIFKSICAGNNSKPRACQSLQISTLTLSEGQVKSPFRLKWWMWINGFSNICVWDKQKRSTKILISMNMKVYFHQWLHCKFDFLS